MVSLTGGSPWGFRLVGGCDFRANLAISKVTPGGKASCAGLKPGDVITSINSLDTTQMTHLEAQNLVKATGATLVLGIASNSAAADGGNVAAPAPQNTNNKPKTYQSSTTIPIGKPATFSIKTSAPAAQPAPATKSPPPVATKTWAPQRPSDFIVNTPSFAASDDPLPPPPPSLSSPPLPPATLPSPPAELPPPPSAFAPPPPAPKPTNIPPPKQNHRRNDDLPPPPSLDSLSINDNAADLELFCEACKKAITGAYLTAQGKNWHPECFVCAIPGCKKSLQSIGFIEEKGQRYCSDCYEKLYANACGVCHKKIVGEVMHALNKTFHVNCFVCIACSKPFRDGVFHLEGDKPYCIEDFNRLFSTVCKACGFRIEAGDGYVEAIKSSWHEACFNCTVCHVDLKNCGFFAVKGRPVCSNHKHAQLAS